LPSGLAAPELSRYEKGDANQTSALAEAFSGSESKRFSALKSVRAACAKSWRGAAAGSWSCVSSTPASLTTHLLQVLPKPNSTVPDGLNRLNSW